MYLNGFERAIGNDMQAARRDSYAGLSLYDLLAHANLFPDQYLVQEADPAVLHDRIRNFDLEQLMNGNFYGGIAGTGGAVEHAVGDVIDTSLTPGELSLHCSFAVFEHVMDPTAVLSFLFESAEPGGLGFHFIDMADHRSYGQGAGTFNKFSFLSQEELPVGVNRLRKSQHIKNFEDAGFEILEVRSRNEEIPEETQASLIPEIKAMSEDDQTAYTSTLIVRRP